MREENSEYRLLVNKDIFPYIFKLRWISLQNYASDKVFPYIWILTSFPTMSAFVIILNNEVIFKETLLPWMYFMSIDVAYRDHQSQATRKGGTLLSKDLEN